MSYKIEIRKHQNIAQSGVNKGQNVIYSCNNGVAVEVLGNNNDTNWYDVTESTIGLENIDLSWEVGDKGGNGKATTLTITGDAFNLVRDWIYCGDCSSVNSFDVKVTDLECKREYADYLIKPDGIEYCLDDGCIIQINLRELNEVYKCLSTITMYDNHQGWFDGENTPNAKQFPTFRVALENDAAGSKIGLALFWQSFPLIQIQLLLANISSNIFNFQDLDFLNTSETTKSALGLDNFATAPRIFELIDNIAAKCGLGVDTFFHSDPFNRDCWLEAQSGKYHKENINDDPEGCFYFWNNTKYRTPKEFFDILAKHYNAEWNIQNGKIVFKLNRDLYLEEPISDFSDLAEDICYEFSGGQKKAGYRFTFAIEDCASNEINSLYSGQASWDKSGSNANLEGVEDCDTQIASTGFLRDGTKEDYTRQAIRAGLGAAGMHIVTLSGSIFGIAAGIVSVSGAVALAAIATLWVGLILIRYREAIRRFARFNSEYTGSIRVCNQTTINIPRIIRWDGVEPMCNAKVVYTDNPAPRTGCNDKPYKQLYSVNADANNASNNFNENGVDYRAFNYPHYFDQNFVNNLYDLHAPTKNPNNNLEAGKQVTFKICKDCQTLSTLGVFKDQDIKLNKFVTIKGTDCFESKVRITKISITNQIITIIGKAFKR